jgi:hypothetical protein
MAEYRELVRRTAAHVGPSASSAVIAEVPEGTVVQVLPDSILFDDRYFKARYAGRGVYFASADAVATTSEPTDVPVHVESEDLSPYAGFMERVGAYIIDVILPNAVALGALLATLLPASLLTSDDSVRLK